MSEQVSCECNTPKPVDTAAGMRCGLCGHPVDAQRVTVDRALLVKLARAVLASFHTDLKVSEGFIEAAGVREQCERILREHGE